MDEMRNKLFSKTVISYTTRNDTINLQPAMRPIKENPNIIRPQEIMLQTLGNVMFQSMCVWIWSFIKFNSIYTVAGTVEMCNVHMDMWNPNICKIYATRTQLDKQFAAKDRPSSDQILSVLSIWYLIYFSRWWVNALSTLPYMDLLADT